MYFGKQRVDIVSLSESQLIRPNVEKIARNKYVVYVYTLYES